MICQRLDDHLDAWVGGTLSEADRQDVEAHLAACPGCREQERRHRQLLQHASALPRSVSPPRDLWPEIAGRIERERAWSWPRIGAWEPVTAVAAVVVVALLAVFFRQPGPTPAHTVVIPSPEAGAPRMHPATLQMDPGLVAIERDYQAAANSLLAALQQRKGELEPQTLAIVERNLAVIDEALAEVHAALEKDPASPELGRMLVSTHRKRVEVLRKMLKLSTAL